VFVGVVVGGRIIKLVGKLSYDRGTVCFKYCCRVVSEDFVHRCQNGVILFLPGVVVQYEVICDYTR